MLKFLLEPWGNAVVHLGGHIDVYSWEPAVMLNSQVQFLSRES